MQLEDMILVSIDDHMIEPPDMYRNHVPAKWLDHAPEGRAQRAGRRRVGVPGRERPRPRSAWPPRSAGPGRSGGSTRARSPSCGPGCFDVHERVRDMNANGVLASMNFPTMAGFNARTFTEAGDKEIALVMLRAYNDWAHRRMVRRVPGPLHPARHRPDVGRRPRRRGGPSRRREGLPFHQLPRDSARAGLPELPVRAIGTR